MESKIRRVSEEYCADNIVRVAKRSNNNRRKYILINPWQGKHVPVSPTKALSMMKSLGEKLNYNYPNTKIIIGFAETATAIGAIVASVFGDDCMYIHTTREEVVAPCLEFLEEHSHAPEQRIITEQLSKSLLATETVIFVDDEISTGRTLCNIISQIKKHFPILNQRRIVAASIINRLSNVDEQHLKDCGIVSESLLKLPQHNYSTVMERLQTLEPQPIRMDNQYTYESMRIEMKYDTRVGVPITKYIEECVDNSYALLSKISLNKSDDILILGTEECMLPGLVLGKKMEEKGYKVYYHATTRSPIGISLKDGYPVQNGWQVSSLYDKTSLRRNYIYNLRSYSQVIIISDTNLDEHDRIQSLLNVLAINGCHNFYFIGRKLEV